MPTKRPDREYILDRIHELYGDYTAGQIATILTDDPNIHAPVTQGVIRNYLTYLRNKHNLELKEQQWTQEDHAFLVDLYQEGAPIPAIAERLGRSIPAVHARISQSGLANRKIDDLDREMIKELLQTTQLGLAQIAYHSGLHYNAVKHVWDQMKVQGERRQNPDQIGQFWREGSLAEQLLRSNLVAIYGDSVVPWQRNREWSKGKGYQIDIPIVIENDHKFAVEVNHFRTHADRRNRDYAKRILAEMEGWVWIPLWINESPTPTLIDEATETVQQIITERTRGSSEYYREFITKVAAQETQYYAPDQPPYDPKANVNFGAFWDESDVAVVLEHYGKLPVEDIQVMLSTARTRDAIVHKARALGLTKRKQNFTTDEDDFLQEVYPEGTKEEILERLPGRTWSSITSRASRLAVLRRDEWTSPEDGILTNHYGTKSDDELMEMLPGRTEYSIRTRANRLGIKKESMWNEVEDDLLEKVYPGESRQVILSSSDCQTRRAVPRSPQA